MSKSSNTYNSTLSTRSRVSLKRSIDCDTSTKKWRDLMQSIVETFWNFNCPVVVNLNMSSITSKILSIEIDSFFAHISIFLTICAILTSKVWITTGTHSYIVTYFYSMGLSTHMSYLSHNLVARTARVLLRS